MLPSFSVSILGAHSLLLLACLVVVVVAIVVIVKLPLLLF